MDRQDAINAMAIVYPEIERGVLGDILTFFNNDVDRACSQLLLTCTPDHEQAAEEQRAIELAIAASLEFAEFAAESPGQFASREQIAAIQIQRHLRSWICQRRIHKLRSLSLGNTPVDVRRRCLESLESAAAVRKAGGRTSRTTVVGGNLSSWTWANAFKRAASRQRVGVYEGVGDAAVRERLIERNDEVDNDDEPPRYEWQPPTLLLATQAGSSSDSVQSSPRDVTATLHDVAISFDAVEQAEQAEQKASHAQCGLLSAEERYASRVGRAKAANAAKKKAVAAANSSTPLLLATDG